jgi:hypothetical protein
LSGAPAAASPDKGAAPTSGNQSDTARPRTAAIKQGGNFIGQIGDVEPARIGFLQAIKQSVRRLSFCVAGQCFAMGFQSFWRGRVRFIDLI